MNDFDPQAFVQHWIDSWNARDVDAVLSHYRDDIQFFSPIAKQVVGTPSIDGHKLLADYWGQAMEKYTQLEFELIEFSWNAERRLIAIYYIANLNGLKRHVCESQWLDDNGKVSEAWACYGAEL